MVEYGIVKVFFGSKSHNKGNFGFIRVIDEDGNRTGEEVYFHLNNAHGVFSIRREGSEAEVSFAAEKATLFDLGHEPRKGDQIVFEAPQYANTGKRRKATSWTFRSIWSAAREAAEDAAPQTEDSFDCCDGYGCSKCDPHWPDDMKDDDVVSPSTIFGRARRHFGNDEEAREAAALYPGDFM